MGVIFWFLILRPQMRQQKAAAGQDRRRSRRAIRCSPPAVWSARSLKVDDDYAELELGPNVKVKALKSTIADIVPPGRHAGQRLTVRGSAANDARFSPLEAGLVLVPDAGLPARGAAVAVLDDQRAVARRRCPSPMVNLGLDLAGGSHMLLEADTDAGRAPAAGKHGRERPRRAAPGASRHPHRRHFESGRPPDLHAREPGADRSRRATLILPLTTGAGLTGQRDWDIKVVDGSRFVLTPTKRRDRPGGRQRDGHRDRSGAQAHRRARHARADDHSPGRRPRSSCRCRGSRTRRRSRTCSARPPSSNSSWSTPTASPSRHRPGHRARRAARSCLIADPARARGAAHRGQAARRHQGRQPDQRQAELRPADQRRRSSRSLSISRAARKFAKLTSENVNKPFAIILDGKVLSAPNINEPILGGSAQISGSFTRRERQPAGHRAALGRAAGRSQGDRGTHRRPRSRRGFDRARA